MSRPGDITGKTVTARLPMEDYIKVLQSATGQNLSVSEYVLLKLFTEERETALKAEIEQLKTNLAQEIEFSEQYKKVSADNLEIAKKAAADLNKSIEEKKKLQQELSAANEAEKRYRGEIATDSKTVAELKNKYAECIKINGDWSKSYEAEKQQKEAAIKDRKAVANLAEGIWNKIHAEYGKVLKPIDEDLRKISRY